MPRGDRTGPMGEGPRTGRAQGHCVGNRESGFMFGRGFRGGFRGRHYRAMPNPDAGAAWSPWDRINELEEQLDVVKDELAKLKSHT